MTVPPFRFSYMSGVRGFAGYMFAQVKKITGFLSKRELYQLGGLLLAVIIMAFLHTLGVASVLPFISLVVKPEIVYQNKWLLALYNSYGFASINSFIIFIGISMFVIILISNAFSAFTTWLKIRFVWYNNHRLSRRLLQKYLSMPYEYFLNHHTADLGKNVLSETSSLTRGFLMPLLELVTKTLVVLFILALLIWVDLIVTLFALLLLGGSYALIYLLIRGKLKTSGDKRLHANKLRYKSVTEAFSGIKEIKISNKESYFLHKYSTASQKHAQLMSWNAVVGQVPRFVLEAIAFGGILLFVLYLLASNESVSQIVPMVSLFALAGYRLMPALQEIFHCITQLQFNQAVINKIYNDLNYGDKSSRERVLPESRVTKALPLKDVLRLKNVSFYYPRSERPVLSEINMSIYRNTSVAFVGSTGAGKTTLVDIILGLLEPREGELFVDDVKLDRCNIRTWQRNFGYVPQQIYLSDDTVSRNIAFGVSDKEIDIKSVERAARIANIHEFILAELPRGYDTVIGERGIRLSGGQRQRIGIARALYHDPEILVFDEATSALDGITEESVLDAMENAARLKTLIVIAHRLSTIEKCNVIYLLDQGRIIAEGSYEELMKTNSYFQAIARVKIQKSN